MEMSFLWKLIFGFMYVSGVFLMGFPLVLLAAGAIWWFIFFILQRGENLRKSLAFTSLSIFAIYLVLIVFATFYKPIQEYMATFAIGMSR
jgi:hypothetical protein